MSKSTSSLGQYDGFYLDMLFFALVWHLLLIWQERSMALYNNQN